MTLGISNILLLYVYIGPDEINGIEYTVQRIGSGWQGHDML